MSLRGGRVNKILPLLLVGRRVGRRRGLGG